MPADEPDVYVSDAQRFTILERDEFRCVYCGKSGDDEPLHVDHVVAKSRGGADYKNLVTACRTCNLGKGARAIRPEAYARILKHAALGLLPAQEPANQKVTIVLTASEKEAAQGEADRTGESRSKVIRRWMLLGMERERTAALS